LRLSKVSAAEGIIVLRIDALKLIDGPIRVDVRETAKSLDLESDPEYEFIGTSSGSVVFTRVKDDVLARGRISMTVRLHCVRCLDAMEVPLTAEVALLYMHDAQLLDPLYAADQTDDVIYYDGIIIEPLADFRELLLLELPAHPRCELASGKRCACQGLREGALSFGPSDDLAGRSATPVAPGRPEPDWKLVLRRAKVRDSDSSAS
jgi:uncharacterized metal-binding protein YceD (DUF177 family)